MEMQSQKTFPKSWKFVGDFFDNDQYAGALMRVAAGEYRVVKLREYGRAGECDAVSVLTYKGADFTKIGCTRFSSTQTVNRYKLVGFEAMSVAQQIEAGLTSCIAQAKI